MVIANIAIGIANGLTAIANIAYAVKHEVDMGFRLAYLGLTLINSKGQSHTHFDLEYL